MAILASHNSIEFGVGDIVRVHQRLFDGGSDKSRVQIFEGTVIGIKGRDVSKTVTVRRIGAQNVGMELIFPLSSPVIEKVDVTKRGVEGTHQAKLYFIRGKSKREIDSMYRRSAKRNIAKK